jgi:polyisoprenoid-binding protein YceI
MAETKGNRVKSSWIRAVVIAMAATALCRAGLAAQAPTPSPAPAKRPPLATFDTSRPAKLDIVSATGRYRVQEQLAGLSVLSDAVGTTTAVTGTLVIAPDGSFQSPSKLSVDLRSLTSDQDMRDNYLRVRVFEVDKFPTMTFVPKRAVGLPSPLPSGTTPQVVGFQLIGDLSLHGVTQEITWDVVGTLAGPTVGGHATTAIAFQTFNLLKPVVPYILKADDRIQLELEFKCTRSAL